MNLKDFLRIVAVNEQEFFEEWNKKLEDITVKIRLIDKEGETIKDYDIGQAGYFDVMKEPILLNWDTFVIEIEDEN